MQAIDKVILGTVQLGVKYGINNVKGKLSENEVFDILDYAFSSGISFLDSADAYGDAERLIGNYHRETGNRFNVISKFKIGTAAIDLATLVEQKLNLLDIDSFYGYMFHSYQEYSNSTDSLKQQLLKYKKNGLIKKIGASVYTNEEFENALQDSFLDLIQLPYNVLDNWNLRGGLLEKAQKRNIEIHARSVFLQGLFFKDENAMPEKLKPLTPYLHQIKAIAQNTNSMLEEIALDYVLSNNTIDKMLVGVDSLEQLQNNIALFKKNNSITESEALNNAVNNVVVKEVELLNPANW